MKEKYSQFYKPSDDDLQKLWGESHFVFDANVLLDLYRYTDKTIKDFWKIFDQIQDRIWLPYQAGLEFHYVRPSRILEQENLFDQTSSTLKNTSDDAIQNLKKTFENTTTHPSIDEKEIINKVDDFFTNLVDEISEKKAEHPDLLTEEDTIRQKLTNFFTNSIGDKTEEKELKELQKEADRRYKKEIPPGFADAEKDGINKYGDYLIWSELLDYAQNEFVKSIIFVTNDDKKDWWNKVHGRTIGPHPDLINEFNSVVGKDYYQYNSERFLKYSKEYIVDVSDESIDEARMISDSIKTKLKEISPEELFYYDNKNAKFVPYSRIIKASILNELNLKKLSDLALENLYEYVEDFKQENPNLSEEVNKARGKILEELLSRGARSKGKNDNG